VNYRRMAVFSFLVLLALLIPGTMLAAMFGWKPLFFGPDLERAGATLRRIDQVVTAAAACLAYIWFLWPLTKRLVVQCIFVFLVVEMIQSMAGFALGDSPGDAFVWQAVIHDAAYAAIGLVLVSGWRFVSQKALT